MKRARIIVLALGIAALCACGEKAQTANSAKKVDAQAFEGAQNPYGSAGWKAGDRASWEEQLRARTQGQNEYVRVN